jgi:hypothetical protein
LQITPIWHYPCSFLFLLFLQQTSLIANEFDFCKK